MLVGLLDNHRIEADAAYRGPVYLCPNCRRAVTLKKGSVVTHHFAHKPPTTCSWASGETQEHLAAKVTLCDALRLRGYRAEFEVEVLSGGGDRRADIFAWTQDGRPQFAVEVQHTPILFDAIERRTKAYIGAGVPVMWLGILTKKMREGERTARGLVLRKYTIRPWEKWGQAFCFKVLWYVDPSDGSLWKGEFSEHILEAPHSSWHSQGGEEHSAGGYTRRSKRWRTLSLEGPHQLAALNVAIKHRNPWSSPVFNLPGGRFAIFERPQR